MSEIMNVIPGFLFTSDDIIAKYASGMKICKNKHARKLYEERRHNGDRKKPADSSKKFNSRFFKSVYHEEMDKSQKAGYEIFSRIADGKHIVGGGSYIRNRAKRVWNQLVNEQLSDQIDTVILPLSGEEYEYFYRKEQVEQLIKELQYDFWGEERYYYAANKAFKHAIMNKEISNKEFYCSLIHMELDDSMLPHILASLSDEEWEMFINNVKNYSSEALLADMSNY